MPPCSSLFFMAASAVFVPVVSAATFAFLVVMAVVSAFVAFVVVATFAVTVASAAAAFAAHPVDKALYLVVGGFARLHYMSFKI